MYIYVCVCVCVYIYIYICCVWPMTIFLLMGHRGPLTYLMGHSGSWGRAVLDP